MGRIAFAAAIALLGSASHAQSFANETRILAYWEKSFGAGTHSGAPATMGFRLSTGPGMPLQPLSDSVVFVRSPLRSVLFDVKFGERGFQSLSLNGIVLRQNEAADGAAPAETNWWVVGGIVAGSAVAMKLTSKNDKDSAPPAATKKGGGT
jgi:hypothetical protein